MNRIITIPIYFCYLLHKGKCFGLYSKPNYYELTKMIYDNLSNVEFYKDLSKDIYEGLVFLKNVDLEIAKGVFRLNPRVKAIVSEYETKKVNEVGFEAHKKFLDIHYVLKGEERVLFMPIERLIETKPYSENDAAFYEANSQTQEMIIGNGYFAIFFPQDCHMPQLCVNEQRMVKNCDESRTKNKIVLPALWSLRATKIA